MSFDVSPAALRGFARGLDDLSADCATAFAYADHTRPPDSGLSAMGTFIERSQGIKPAVKSFCHRLEQVSTDSADELVLAAGDYQRRDATTAAALDAEYPPVPAYEPPPVTVGSGGGGGSSGAWGDDDAVGSPGWYDDGNACVLVPTITDDPASALTEPVATVTTPDLVETFCNLSDLLSLGHWALEAIDLMGGPDIPEKVGEYFAGDWQAVSKSADAMRRLGLFASLAAQDVRAGLADCREQWHGNASDAAAAYFLGLADDVAAQQGPLDEMAGHVETTAEAVKALATGCGDAVESLADYAIATGISLAAAATNFWNPIGWGGAASAAYSIARGADKVLEIIDACTYVYDACAGIEGLIAGALAELEGFENTPLPQGYDHGLVPG